MADVYVLDSSALLAFLLEEPGSDRVEAVLDRSRISSVNFVEVVSRLQDRGDDMKLALADLEELGVPVVNFDRAQAEIAGLLRAATRAAGLSLGDRACLALAHHLGASVLTSDREMARVDVGVSVERLR